MKNLIIASVLQFVVLYFATANQTNGNRQTPTTSDTLLVGGQGLDVGNYIIPVSNGGYLAVGYFAADPDGNYVGAAVRLDNDKNIAWTKTYRKVGDNRAWSVSEAPNGDFMIAGFSNSFNDSELSDVWLFRISSEGDLLWEKSFGGNEDDLAWDIKNTNDGNYIIAAQTGSKGAGNLDAWLIKVDGEGNIIWDRTYGSVGLERIFQVTEGMSGELYATGIYTKGTRQDPIDVYTVCVNNQSGDLIWEDYLDKGKDDTGHGLIYDKKGGVWVAGYTTSLGNGAQDGFLARYDIEGTITNFFNYGGEGMDRVMNVIHGNNDDLWLVGYSESYGSDFDMWVVQTDYEGTHVKNFTLKGDGNDRGVHMLVDDKNVVVVGTYVSSKNGDPDFIIWNLD